MDQDKSPNQLDLLKSIDKNLKRIRGLALLIALLVGYTAFLLRDLVS